MLDANQSTWTELMSAYQSKKVSSVAAAKLLIFELVERNGLWCFDEKQSTKDMLVFRSLKWVHTDNGQADGEWFPEPATIELNVKHLDMRVEAFTDFGSVNVDLVLACRLTGYMKGAKKIIQTAEKQLNCFLNAADIVCKPFCKNNGLLSERLG